MQSSKQFSTNKHVKNQIVEKDQSTNFTDWSENKVLQSQNLNLNHHQHLSSIQEINENLFLQQLSGDVQQPQSQNFIDSKNSDQLIQVNSDDIFLGINNQSSLFKNALEQKGQFQTQKSKELNKYQMIYQLSQRSIQHKNDQIQLIQKDQESEMVEKSIQLKQGQNIIFDNNYKIAYEGLFNTLFIEVNQIGLDSQQDTDEKKYYQTKNIGKNFLKAFAHFILKESNQVDRVLNQCLFSKQYIDQFKSFIRYKIRKQNQIPLRDIKKLLCDQQNFAKEIRILMFYFLRRRMIGHIYNSKIQKRKLYLRYIQRWKQILSNPQNFDSIAL